VPAALPAKADYPDESASPVGVGQPSGRLYKYPETGETLGRSANPTVSPRDPKFGKEEE
jgi:hypothetical protein